MIFVSSFLLFLVPCLGAPASHSNEHQPVSSRGNVISNPVQFYRGPKTINTRTRRETHTPTAEDIKEMYRNRSSEFDGVFPKGLSAAARERIMAVAAQSVANTLKKQEAEREKFQSRMHTMNTFDPTRFLPRTKRETQCGMYDSDGINSPEDCEGQLEKISRGRSNNAFQVRTKRGHHAGEEPGRLSSTQSKRSSLKGPIKFDPQTTGPYADIPQREKRQVSGQEPTEQSNTIPGETSEVDPFDEYEEEFEEGRDFTYNTHQDLPRNSTEQTFLQVAAKILMINKFVKSEDEARLIEADTDIYKFTKNNSREDTDDRETNTPKYREKINTGRSNDFLVRTKRGHHAEEEPGSPSNNQPISSSQKRPLKVGPQTTGSNVDVPKRAKRQSKPVGTDVAPTAIITVPDIKCPAGFKRVNNKCRKIFSGKN